MHLATASDDYLIRDPILEQDGFHPDALPHWIVPTPPAAPSCSARSTSCSPSLPAG